MRRWSKTRQAEWSGFTRILARMGRLLERHRKPEGGYVSLKTPRLDPLLELAITEPGVLSSIGLSPEGKPCAVLAMEHAKKGVLAWVNLRRGGDATTIRINYKGPRERVQAAADAVAAALLKMGRRVGYRETFRHENQNGYVALIRVPDAPLALGFAR